MAGGSIGSTPTAAATATTWAASTASDCPEMVAHATVGATHGMSLAAVPEAAGSAAASAGVRAELL